jgi:Terminase large subunit, T4likevirus-type, N-terminal
VSATIGEYLAAALDLVVFAHRAGLTAPDPWQVAVLRSTAPALLLNCHRQSGKSTIAALLALHLAIYQPGSTAIIVSPGLRQSQELFAERLMRAWHALGRPVRTERSNLTGLWLTNGSRILALPGSEQTIRGPSADLLILDEASRISDDLFAAATPMLAATHGRMLAMSTPWRRTGWWAAAWADRGPEWERHRFPADANPRMDPAWLAQQRTQIGERRFLREYLCRFGEDEFSLFAERDIADIFTEAGGEWWLE